MKIFLNSPIGIVFISILTTFVVARFVSYMVLVWKILPQTAFLSVGSFRLHHFVYGNILIIATSFYIIVLGNRPTNITYYLYGIGLGLILDELPHWSGDLVELNRNVPIVKLGAIAVAVTLLLLIAIFYIKNKG